LLNSRCPGLRKNWPSFIFQRHKKQARQSKQVSPAES
jgi:hypothetical protein